MKPSVTFERKRRAVRETACRFRTANPGILGAVLHGTDQDDSNLDPLRLSAVRDDANDAGPGVCGQDEAGP